jgi:hypothetical protein
LAKNRAQPGHADALVVQHAKPATEWPTLAAYASLMKSFKLEAPV